MVQHVMNIWVDNQKLPMALFRIVNTTEKPRSGQVVIRLKRGFQETLTHKIQTASVGIGGNQLFFFDIPEPMDSFYTYEWWWVAADGGDGNTLEGKGNNSKIKKRFKGKELECEI
jgi:hypothetical protein